MGIGEAQTMTNNRLTAVPPSLDHLTNTKRNGVAVIVAALHVPIVEEHMLSPKTVVRAGGHLGLN